MKKPLPTSIPSIIPAAVLAEAKEKKLVYVGTGDSQNNMFNPPVKGYRWIEGERKLCLDNGMIGFYKFLHFFLPRKTAAQFFILPKAPKTRFFKVRDSLLNDARTSGDWIELTAAEAKAYLSSLKKPEPDIETIYKPYGKSAITKLTEENTLLKARVATLEAAIRDAAKAL